MASAQAVTNGDFSAREQIAFTVIKYAGIGLALLVVGITFYAVSSEPGGTEPWRERTSILLTVFNATLPLIGTWVGTVMAFYFTKENFSTASQETRKLVESLSDQKLKSIMVEDAMLRQERIENSITLDPSSNEKGVATKDLLARLRPPVSRVPVFVHGSKIRYILHDSMIYKDKALHGGTMQDASGQQRDRTLADMLDDAELKALFTAVAVVPKSATLADAKSRMEGLANCRDVFVTETGRADEPVLGWITDRDIPVKGRA